MNYQNEISVHCGKVADGMRKLENLCKEEAEKLLVSLDIPTEGEISVPFWTSDFPELICVGLFKKDRKGVVAYELDFSESTL